MTIQDKYEKDQERDRRVRISRIMRTEKIVTKHKKLVRGLTLFLPLCFPRSLCIPSTAADF